MSRPELPRCPDRPDGPQGPKVLPERDTAGIERQLEMIEINVAALTRLTARSRDQRRLQWRAHSRLSQWCEYGLDGLAVTEWTNLSTEGCALLIAAGRPEPAVWIIFVGHLNYSSGCGRRRPHRPR